MQTKYMMKKRRKYAALSEEIERNGFRCSVKPVIVGSTGSVHKMALPHLMQMGLPKKQGKGLCKWFSNSNILVARSIWNVRCRRVLGNN